MSSPRGCRPAECPTGPAIVLQSSLKNLRCEPAQGSWSQRSPVAERLVCTATEGSPAMREVFQQTLSKSPSLSGRASRSPPQNRRCSEFASGELPAPTLLAAGPGTVAEAKAGRWVRLFSKSPGNGCGDRSASGRWAARSIADPYPSDPAGCSRDDSFPGQPGYIAHNCIRSMSEIVLMAGVIGLLALIWMGLDSDDDNGGGGLMQPVLVPVRSRRS